MPSFLKDLSIRRRSKASIADSSGHSSLDNGENSKSSSTLNSYLDNKQSPPTTLSSSRSNTNLSGMNGSSSKTPPPVPGRETRPRLPSSHSNRYSINVPTQPRRSICYLTNRVQGMPAQNGDRPMPTTSPLAPRVLSVSDGSWVLLDKPYLTRTR